MAQALQYLQQNPLLVEPVVDIAGGIVEGIGGMLGIGQEARARSEREKRLVQEAEKTKELLREESKIASEERKEVYGLESQKSQEMLDKELKYLSTLADKNIELFNRYFENLATKRQELLSRGLRPEDIPDFFSTLLSARQNIMAQASGAGLQYQVPIQTGLTEARMARIGQIQQGFTPLSQPEALPRMKSLAPAVRSLATAYFQANKQGGMFPVQQKVPKVPVATASVGVGGKIGKGEKKKIIAEILRLNPNANVSGDKVSLKKKLEKLKKKVGKQEKEEMPPPKQAPRGRSTYGGKPQESQLAQFKEAIQKIPVVAPRSSSAPVGQRNPFQPEETVLQKFSKLKI